jgi:hypothetical protein
MTIPHPQQFIKKPQVSVPAPDQYINRSLTGWLAEYWTFDEEKQVFLGANAESPFKGNLPPESRIVNSSPGFVQIILPENLNPEQITELQGEISKWLCFRSVTNSPNVELPSSPAPVDLGFCGLNWKAN